LLTCNEKLFAAGKNLEARQVEAWASMKKSIDLEKQRTFYGKYDTVYICNNPFT